MVIRDGGEGETPRIIQWGHVIDTSLTAKLAAAGAAVTLDIIYPLTIVRSLFVPGLSCFPPFISFAK